MQNNEKRFIIKVMPFTDTTEKIIYSNGGIGFRLKGSSSRDGSNIPENSRMNGPMEWPASMDEAPASDTEIDQMMDELRSNEPKLPNDQESIEQTKRIKSLLEELGNDLPGKED